MDINRIRYFLSLVKTASMTKAAELHHISTPALSKAIKVFEGEVNEKLIVPHGRGILLTDRAHALVPIFEEILKKLDSVIEKTEDNYTQPDQTLRIATFEVFSTHFMERTLNDIFKNKSCLLYESIPGQMEAAVARRDADFAITYIPIPHPELDHMRIMPLDMGVFGLRKKFDDFSENQTPFVIPTAPIEGSPNKVRGLDGWPEEAFPRKVQYRVAMLETALGLCRRGLAVVYLPRFIAKFHNEIVKPEFYLDEKKLPKKFPVRKDYIYLVKRKTDLEDSVAKKLASSLRRLCSSGEL